jgi:hypothetical protein
MMAADRDHQVDDRGGRARGRCGRCGGLLRTRLRSGMDTRRVGVDRSPGSADGGRADLCEFDRDARLSAPESTGSSTARWLLGPGISATLAADVAHGLGHGLIGAAVAAWPAVALVGSYELLMMVIRGVQAPAAASGPHDDISVADRLRERVAVVSRLN